MGKALRIVTGLYLLAMGTIFAFFAVELANSAFVDFVEPITWPGVPKYTSGVAMTVGCAVSAVMMVISFVQAYREFKDKDI